MGKGRNGYTKIAIFGMHGDTQTGFNADDWGEVWGLAHDPDTPHRCTAAFEAHSEAIVRHHGPAHIERLELLADIMPLYTLWPWERSLGKFHVHLSCDALPTRMIESSVAYPFAYAILRAEKIGLYGVDMAAGEEYAYQRPNMAYLVGKAEGNGIEVFIHPESGLLKSEWTGGMYGHPDNIDDIEYRLV